jgi:hypothetical protein
MLSETTELMKKDPKMTEGINIQHHDHDYHPKNPHDGYGYSGMGVWGIFGFIAFVVIIGWIWGVSRRIEEHHNRDCDKHNDNMRGMDKLGYELGYTRKQLNDMQTMQDKTLCKEDKIYDRMCYERENVLQFGTPYGEHTQRLCTAKPSYCGGNERGYRGGIMNGSQVSETATFAVDHSVI